MQFDVVTLFPEMVSAPFRFSLLGKAASKGCFSLNVHDLRSYAEGRHRVCDDYPFGGGEGMVLKVEPISRALKDIVQPGNAHRVLLMSPGGLQFDQSLAHQLTRYEQIVLICGHYEGVDDRVRQHLVDDEISIGDYILTGGELPAMVVVEAVARLLEGVVGSSVSLENESFEKGILDHPHYTRPREFDGMKVPEILFSGDHKRIEEYKRQEALRRTLLMRPDLLAEARLSAKDKQFLARASYPTTANGHEEDSALKDGK